MVDLIIPIFLSFLGPGTGQLYNREFKKAAYLIVLSLMIFLGASYFAYQAALPYLPTDLSAETDPAALQQMLQSALNHVLNAHSSTLMTYKILFLAIWLYSMIDAYFGALRRQAMKIKGGRP